MRSPGFIETAAADSEYVEAQQRLDATPWWRFFKRRKLAEEVLNQSLGAKVRTFHAITEQGPEILGIEQRPAGASRPETDE